MLLQACRCRLRVGVDGALGITHSKNPYVCSCFQGTWGSLLQHASYQAEGTCIPSAFTVEWQHVWGGSLFQMFEVFTGLQNALNSSRGRRDLHRISVESWAGHVPAPDCRILGIWRKRLVLMNEWGTLLSWWWAAVLVPVLFSLKRPSEISFLPFEMSIYFLHSPRAGRPDWNQVWWIKQCWSVSSRMLSESPLVAAWLKNLPWYQSFSLGHFSLGMRVYLSIYVDVNDISFFLFVLSFFFLLFIWLKVFNCICVYPTSCPWS